MTANRKTSFFIEIVKEITPVIIGILVALLINNWNEERQNTIFVNDVLQSISIELEENKKKLEQEIPKQKMLIDSIKYYLSKDEISLLEILSIADGFTIPTIKNTSWRAFFSKDIRLVGYSIISELTNIEEDKTTLKLQANTAMNLFYENENVSEYKKKEKFILLIEDILHIEGSLLTAHKKCLNAISENYNQ